MNSVIRFIKLFSFFVVGEILFGGEVLMHERKNFWDVYEEDKMKKYNWPTGGGN